jgi:DNA repair photolyase
MIVKEIQAKSILSPSKIYPYVINPYQGCQFGCTYCYAKFMRRFTGHKEPWGEFVDVKINAAELLRKEVKKKKRDVVWISGVCDPYQPLETKYALTRECIKILAENDWPVVIQTKSSLILRDMDILTRAKACEAGLSITTAEDTVRELFEPKAPKIMDRVNALGALHAAGIPTYAMIAPALPGAERLISLLEGKVDYIYLDKMNYVYAKGIYRSAKLEQYLTEEYFEYIKQKLLQECKKTGIECRIVY